MGEDMTVAAAADPARIHVPVMRIDRDPDALAIARARLERFGDRFIAVEAVYDELPEVLGSLGIAEINAMLLDLGLSSLQIDRRERGFAYSVDAPLDMRMDGKQGLTAADVINRYEPRELVRILRIEVNAELEALEGVLPAALDALAVGGRIAVLAYHSLEDRMVKTVLREGATDKAPKNLPVVPEGMRAELMLLTRGAEKPGDDEVQSNPRAASARSSASATTSAFVLRTSSSLAPVIRSNTVPSAASS